MIHSSMTIYSSSSVLLLSAAASFMSVVPEACVAFSPLPSNANLPASSITTALFGTKVGVFFGTSTGSTEEVAYAISEQFGSDVASEPIEIDGVADSVASEFAKYDALVVGTPTWNTGADQERSGTGWDEIYYSTMEDLNIAGKRVAVFGLGDSVSYAENYADAAGELHDVFENLGCQMLGYTSQEGYLHEASKSIRGDKFCGLLCDAVNQEELTEGRVQKWVEQLIGEGILEGGAAGGTASSEEPAPAIVDFTAELEENSILMEETIAAHSSSDAFEPHYNARSGVTMWTSPDGRTCYYTKEATRQSVSP